ncbi:MAG: hypothetical protein N3D11_05730 [Candidatus Sumerlaeia bacterium]|nr:hypothetical protein [Candidatus Sumerlaeia bacterium]
MKRLKAISIIPLLVAMAGMALGGVATRPPRQQDKAFRFDPRLGVYVREIDRDTGIDQRPGLGDPSPVDITNNASQPQFTRAFNTDQTNSRIDDYINQDEQINLSPDTGAVRVLRVNQKRLLNDYVTALVPLKNVNPREMRGVFRNVCGKEGGFADVLQDFETKENFLQVVCPKFQLEYVVNALKALDEKWVAENNDGRVHAYYRPKFRDAGPLLNLLQFFRSPMETFCWDELGNAIQFTGEPAVVNGLFPYGCKMCDIPPSQIKLDIAIYEVNVKNDLKLGLDFVTWKNSAGADLFEFAGAAGSDYVGHFRWANLHGVATSAYVDFLASKGKARLVNRGTLTAKSGTLGELAAVDQQLAFNIEHNPDRSRYLNTGFVDQPMNNWLPNGPAAGSVSLEPAIGVATANRRDAIIPQFHDRVVNYIKSGTVGVFIGAVPYVGLESAEVALSLHVTDFDGYTPQGQPIISHRFTDSYVRVFPDQPFVLAGITRHETVKSRNGVPFFSKLPVIGWAFGGETNSQREVELVVVITPTFDVSTDSKIEKVEAKLKLTADEQLAKDFVAGQAAMNLPKNWFGFDQWVLGNLDN